MKKIVIRLWNEPVYLGTVLIAVVGMVAGFGLGWTGEQVSLVTTGIALITGATVRQRVSPTEGHVNTLT